MLIWPTIPDPMPDPTTHTSVLQVMKNMLEMLTGQRKGLPVSIPRVFRSDIKPGAPNSPFAIGDLRDNDLWIDTMHTSKLNYWNAAQQVWVPTT